MSDRLPRFLRALVLGGSALTALAWLTTLSVRCEGFACVAVGPLVALAVLCNVTSLLAGAVLLGVLYRRGRVPAWLWALEAALLMPLAALIARNLLRPAGY